MTDELNAGILLTNDCFLCDKLRIESTGTRYCKYYMQSIISKLYLMFKYKNITEIHCIYYQREKESIKNKEV